MKNRIRNSFSIVILMLFTQLSYSQSWQLVWQDEFDNGISNDWVFDIGRGSSGWGNNELQYYRQENATVENGNLVIRAKRESFGGAEYTSARLRTQGKKSWKYGKIEARIAAPSFQGIWPAFWMLGDNITSVGWPKCGEIDILEHVNTGNQVYGTVHWDENGHAEYSGNIAVNDITTYHTYTVEWNESSIKWFVDGNKYHEINIAGGVGGTSEFHEKFYILLNLAVGGNWPGFSIDNNGFPATMKVDYVRVYQWGNNPSVPSSTGLVTTYNDCNYGGFSGGLDVGDYNLAALQAKGVGNDVVSSIKVAQGYKVILYSDDNFLGSSVTLTSDSSCLDATWNDKVSSIKVRPNGVTTLAGKYTLQNRHSGLNMDVVGGPSGSSADGINIQQWNVSNTTNQQFNFEHLGDGVYKITAVHSGKCIDVNGISKDNGANVQQWTYYGTANQQFIVYAMDAGYYKLIAKHSGKVVEVAGYSTAAEGNVQQWENVNQTSGHWKLNPVAVTSTVIQAENYSSMSGVQVEATTDAGGGSNVGYCDTGDWMAYTNINFPTTGSYLIEYRVASAVTGAKISSDLNAGSIVLGTLNVPNTGGWQNWQTISHTVNVNAGTYNFGIFIQTTGVNINWIRITKVANTARMGQESKEERVEETEISLYPNPTDSILYFSDKISTSTITITDIQRGVVLTKKVINNSVNVSDLPSGVYTLEVNSPTGKRTLKRFIKK